MPKFEYEIRRRPEKPQPKFRAHRSGRFRVIDDFGHDILTDIQMDGHFDPSNSKTARAMCTKDGATGGAGGAAAPPTES